MDPFNYAAPARIGALVLPVGTLKASQFQQYYERLGQAAEVGLLDVHLPAGAGADDEAHRQFDPKAYPTGHLVYNFQKQVPPAPVTALFDLEPWRQQMLVVGIAHHSAVVEEDADVGDALKRLKALYPAALCHVVLVFGVPPAAAPDWPPRVFPILSSNWTSLETVLSTVTGLFLAALSSFWISRRLGTFQSPASRIGSRSTTGPVAPARGRHNAHMHSPSSLEPVVGRHGSISMGSAERAKGRQEGRTRKFLGSLFLLSGRVPDAIAELGAAAAILKELGDHLWYASALDSIGLCLVMQKYASPSAMSSIPSAAVASAWAVALKHVKSASRQAREQKEHISSQPEVTYSTAASPQPSPRTSTSTASSFSLSRVRSLRKSTPFTSQTPVEDMLEYLVKAVLDEFALGVADEVVPYTVFYETLIRYINLLLRLRLGRGWTEAAMSAAIRDTPIAPGPAAAWPSIGVIEDWISRIHNPDLAKLSAEAQTRILTAVAAIYARAGLQRKWAFVCSHIVSILAASPDAPIDDLGAVDGVLEVFSSWPKLEATLLRKLVALGQRMLNPEVQIAAASRLLAMARENYIAPKEQLALYQLIRSYSDVVQGAYWDNQLVVDLVVKTHRLSTVRAPKTDTSIIYNPFEGTESKTEGSVESGIATPGRVYLRNPFAIDLQVFELFLVDSSGSRISEVAKDLVIPASTPRFRVETSVVPPTNQAELEVAGCYVQLSGCQGQIYEQPVARIPITPARPVLVLQELSLQKGWTMLLEGEVKRFSITLWNCSAHTPSSVLHFGFNDSTVDPLRSAAARVDVPRAEFYEYEYFLHRRRAIDPVSPVKPIEPCGSQKFEFDLAGKRGITSAAILVDYGLTEDSLRRLRIPLQVTVCPSISVERASLVPTGSTSVVLLVLDLRNSWRESVTVTLWSGGADADDEKSSTVVQLVESQQTRRFLLEVPWQPLTREELRRPIPSLSNKQFTVDTRTTPEQLRAFWLREKLLERIHGQWTTAAGRTGYVELRSIQLSRQMAAVLTTSAVEVSMAHTLDKTQCAVDTPVTLEVSVANKATSAPTQGMLRLIPSSKAQRFVLLMGAAQQLIRLGAGDAQTVRFEAVFLSQGLFEFTSVFDVTSESGPMDSVFQTEPAVFNVHT